MNNATHIDVLKSYIHIIYCKFYSILFSDLNDIRQEAFPFLMFGI